MADSIWTICDICHNGLVRNYLFFFIVTISLFGTIEINYIEYPSIDLARLIEIPLFERMEIIFLTTWIIVSFSVNYLTFYAATISMKSLFRRGRFTFWIVIMGVFSFFVAIFPQNIENVQFMASILEIVSVVFLFVFFPILVVIDTVKKKVKQNGTF